MFTASAIPSRADGAVVQGRVSTRLGRLVRRMVRSWARHQALMAWNRELPRPIACARVPDRVWRRHSALLSLRSQAMLERER